MQHMECGTTGFSRSMDALPYNVLVCSYLRWQYKRQVGIALNALPKGRP